MDLSYIGYIVGLIAMVWVIYDVLVNQSFSIGKKLIWIICAILFSVITAIVYFFVVKRK